jgi:predicted acyltransferase
MDTQDVAAPAAPKKERLLSLDVFRGFTLIGMVLVNSHPGKIFPGLGHASWDGWGFADIIFPFFLFIVGVAMPYSFAGRLARGDGPGKLLWQVVRRTLLLFALGLFLNAYPKFDLATLRIMGILQRIAICYFLASVLYIYLRPAARTIVWICGTILVLYYVLMVFVPVPGYGAGVLKRWATGATISTNSSCPDTWATRPGKARAFSATSRLW